MNKKVLLIGDINIIFTYEFILKILRRIDGIQVDIINFAPLSEKNTQRDEHLRSIGCNISYQPAYAHLKKIRLFHPILRVFEAKRYFVSRKYDVINIHFPGVDSWIIPHVIKPDTILVTSIYGSDFLRSSKRTNRVLKALFKRSKYITVASSFVKNEISIRFQKVFDDKIQIAKYGSIACEEMHYNLLDISRDESKQSFGIPTDRISIMCGYNGSEAQRHIDIIDECKKLPIKYKDKIHLLFHCSYGGNDSYIQRVRDHLASSGIPFTFLTEFMTGEKLSRLRKSADIFINVQPTDVLSASMIEELEAGAICIIGNWLKYPDLEEFGVSLETINSISDLSICLSDIIAKQDEYISKTIVNKGVWKILSWDKDFETWKRLICD